MLSRRAMGAALVSVLVIAFVLSLLAGPPDVSEGDSPTLDQGVPDPFRGQKADPGTVVYVGNAGDGNSLRVWNNGSTARPVSVELRHDRSDSTLVDRTVTLQQNGTLLLELRSPGDYFLTVTDERTGTTETHPMSSDDFDCNDRLTTVRVSDDGSVDTRTIATEVMCGGFG